MNEDQQNYAIAYENVSPPESTIAPEDWVLANWPELVLQGIQKPMNEIEKHVLRNIQ